MDFGQLLNLGTTYLSYEAQKDAADAQASAATKAATAGVKASDEQIAFNKWLYNQQTELQKPYYNVGTSALPLLQARAGISPQAQRKPQLQKIPRYSADQASKIDNVYDYVSNLYIDGLGREGTQSDINKWVEGIATGQYDKKSVIDAFMTEAQNTGVTFDTNKLNDIKNAVNVQNSRLATPSSNYLNTYNQYIGGEGDGGGMDFSDVSAMGGKSAFGGISFKDIGNFVEKHADKAIAGLTALAPEVGAPLAVVKWAYDTFLGDENSPENGAASAGATSAVGIEAAMAGSHEGSGDSGMGDSGTDSGDMSSGGSGGFGSDAEAAAGGYSGGW